MSKITAENKIHNLPEPIKIIIVPGILLTTYIKIMLSPLT